MVRALKAFIDRVCNLFPAAPTGMTLYDRGDKYAPPPCLTARTQAGLLGAHIAHAGRFTRGRG